MTYESLLDELSAFAEEEFAKFQKKLIFTSYEIIGVRTPILRKLAKKYSRDRESIYSFPNEYYEVVFIKFCLLSAASYEELVERLDKHVALIDNWALCDTFKPRGILKRRDEFLEKLEEIFSHGGEFYERFVLVTLLNFYLDEKFELTIKKHILSADTQSYYVHVAVAWLVAELLVKIPRLGKELLISKKLPPKTHNKAIQKARESFRVEKEEKERLKALKIK